MLVADPSLPGGERAKILDFGIVKILQGEGGPSVDNQDGPTRNGLVLGTPRYMAPEQWKCGGRIDAKTDVYALGVITFLGLTGELPFHAVDAPELGMMHCYKMAPSLASINPSLPPQIVELVARMLEKDPERRPSMSTVAETLGRFLPRHGFHDKMPGSISNSDVEISIHLPAEGTQKLTVEELLLDDNAAELTQPLQQIRERPTRRMSLVSMSLPVHVPHRHPEFAADLSTEPSEGSLLVGSNDNLRPPHGIGSWLAGGAAVALAIAAVYFMIHMRPLRAVDTPSALHAAVRAAQIDSPPSAPAQLANLASASSSEPDVAKPRAPTKTAKPSARRLPNQSCIKNATWSSAEQQMLLRAFVRSGAKLRPADSLVLSNLRQTPKLASTPRSLSRHKRAELVKELRRISPLFTAAVPSLVEIRCP